MGQYLRVLAILLLGSVASLAQETKPLSTCPEAPSLVAVADYLLTEPTEIPRLWRDYEAADAAFVKLRYTDFSYEKARDFLAQLALRERPPQRLEELRLTQANPADRAAMLAQIAPAEALKTGPSILGASALRALALDGGGEALVGLFLRWRDSDPSRPAKAGEIAMSIAPSLGDLSDAQKQSVAGKAEAAGLWKLAMAVSAQQSNFSDLVALLDRMPDAEFGQGSRPEIRQAWLRHFISMSEFGAVPLDMESQPQEVREIAASRQNAGMMRPLARLALLAPETGFVSTVFNLTGDIRLATELAPAMVRDIEAKTLDPVGAPDAVIAELVTRIDAIIGAEARARQLASFDYFQESSRKLSTMTEQADAVLARHALAPVVLGAVPGPVEKPTGVSAGFDWPQWSRIAGALSKRDAISDADRLTAAQLLIGAERVPEALDMIRLAPSPDAARTHAYALMTRLERRCGDLLTSPMPFRDHIFRF